MRTAGHTPGPTPATIPIIGLGTVTDLTLGGNGNGSENKRKIYARNGG